MAGEQEIKRSYRRLVAKYHPDVNQDPNAHFIIVEINEAYEVLSNPSLKWVYDQRFLAKSEIPAYTTHHYTPPPPVDEKRARRGKKETEEEKNAKRIYVKKRNRAFNKKMKVLSLISLLFAGLIFTDHYLPTETSYRSVYTTFKPEEIANQKDLIVSIFVNKGKKIEVYPISLNYDPVAILPGEALFQDTPILGILKTVQIGKLVMKPFDGLYDLMLMFGIVCMASIYVLSYKLEESLVLPTIVTFFDNMLVITFFTMWFME